MGLRNQRLLESTHIGTRECEDLAHAVARTGARMTRALGFAPELLPTSGVSRFECFDVAQTTR